MSLSNERLNLQELQNDLDRETSSLQELEAQKQDAQDRLDEMDQQKAKLKDMLSDVGQKCQEETQVVSERVEGSRLAVRTSRTSTLMERWLGDEQPSSEKQKASLLIPVSLTVAELEELRVHSLLFCICNWVLN